MKVINSLLVTLFLTTSITTYAELPADTVAEHQQNLAADEINSNAKATPKHEARPAATTKSKSKNTHSTKHLLMTRQKAQAAKSISDAKAAKPDVEARPAATTTHE